MHETAVNKCNLINIILPSTICNALSSKLSMHIQSKLLKHAPVTGTLFNYKLGYLSVYETRLEVRETEYDVVVLHFG